MLTNLARAAFGVIALRVLDDTVLQPPAGVPVTERPLAALVPLALLALAAYAYPRLPNAARAALAVTTGVLGLAAGLDAVYYTREVGLSADDVTGWLALPAALALIGVGIAEWWRSQRRLATAAVGLVALLFGVVPFATAYVKAHVASATVPEPTFAHEDVTFRSSDGLALKGWYVPSRNGKAVIVFPGRKGPQAHARMLARHGYGVLLFDRRGEGVSEGQPNTMGWGGEADIRGAVAFLEGRGITRIGGLGLSVGGEMMLEAATKADGLDAVVSEGAGARTMAEAIDRPGMSTPERAIGVIQYAAHDLGLFLATGDTPARHLDGLTGRIEQPTLLIAAPRTPNGETLNRVYAQGSDADLWEIPEARHIKGIEARPAEYERRVTRFFDQAL
ncbi:alpha/beta hydrolase [Solirubrobacter deserti]|uniref:Xaa-Pro dipeptidyl-peptidase-like domain-containing protein n=1 Tax=Solirubrobacter deserti TaxID=2282478 RepID=A0ABT4RSW0_9ACTN|nr:CocE/NonD family hydrolase [Solirubrobacter deserti]MDA0141654.1 hypothetical protein [Solirubrobacter deserti]